MVASSLVDYVNVKGRLRISTSTHRARTDTSEGSVDVLDTHLIFSIGQVSECENHVFKIPLFGCDVQPLIRSTGFALTGLFYTVAAQDSDIYTMRVHNVAHTGERNNYCGLQQLQYAHCHFIWEKTEPFVPFVAIDTLNRSMRLLSPDTNRVYIFFLGHAGE